MYSKKKLEMYGKKKYLIFGILLILALTVTISLNIPAESRDGKINILLEIENGAGTSEEKYTVNNGTTAFQVLNETHSVEYKEYSIGYFITSIDGVEQNTTHSWLYFINGDPSSVSSDRYYLSDGDILDFKFLSNEEGMKYFK